MKTIEERAKEYADRLKNAEISYFGIATVYSYKYVYNANMAAYKRGANEQKAIDEEVRLKKCDDMTKAEYDREVAFAEWYHKNGKGTPTFSDAIEWARKETIIKVFDRLAARHVISELSVEGFKKAMEEEL